MIVILGPHAARGTSWGRILFRRLLEDPAPYETTICVKMLCSSEIFFPDVTGLVALLEIVHLQHQLVSNTVFSVERVVC
jgi:hypothetical protein